MSIQIKVNSITNLTDARYFAAKEVAYLGFNLDEKNKENYIDPINMKAIKEWVEGPKIMGEFRYQSPDVIVESALFFGLNAIQVPVNQANIRLIELLEVHPIEVWGKLDFNYKVNISIYTDKDIDQINLNDNSIVSFQKTYLSWSDIKKDVSVLDFLSKIKNLYLDIDFSLEELPEILEIVQPLGLCMTGGDEERVGVKSFDDIDEIFDILYES
jgi:phosphoribosylanthranilate isomerase